MLFVISRKSLSAIVKQVKHVKQLKQQMKQQTKRKVKQKVRQRMTVLALGKLLSKLEKSRKQNIKINDTSTCTWNRKTKRNLYVQNILCVDAQFQMCAEN